ncbi:hypothetical protein J7E99_40015, partial [Streptomyces sp. ISL-44]|nr:hypothetical protein [Streptomyces sp. ISL-44]
MADQNVVDEFWLAGMDAGVALVFGDAWGEVPQPGLVALVGGFTPIPKRWAVERTYSWLMLHRRL